jgi:hypothetical protein
MQIRDQMRDMKRLDQAVSVYYNKLKSLFDNITLIGQPLRPEEFTSFGEISSRHEGISSGPTQMTTCYPKRSMRINKWVKVLLTGRPKRTAETGPMHSRPICGRKMR